MNTKSSILIFVGLLFFSCENQEVEYICTPCNLECDNLTFLEAGICPHCKMELIKKSDLILEEDLVLNEINIQEGNGAFLIEAGSGKVGKSIKVVYYVPKNFKPDSKILLVIPGAGRSAASYRDAWVEEAEQYGVLILAPEYSEADYSFEDYHMCGLIYDLDLENSLEYMDHSNIVKLDDELFTYKVNTNNKKWIFSDFDRIFDRVVEATKSTQTKYDVFGHSAGGQILHRFSIFQPSSKARHIIAANAGFYTIPNFEWNLPFGLKDAPVDRQDLPAIFNTKLTLLVGALDNQDETGGTLLRSTIADKQGLHRLERGQYFYNQSKLLAEEMKLGFNWNIEIVPGVGHNHRAMGDAAGVLLYSN